MNDFGDDHLLIVRRLEVVNEPLDHLIFHHGELHLCSQFTPPLGILSKRFCTLLFCSLKNYAVGSYLGVELVVFLERVSPFLPAKGLFQARISYGHGASQIIRENLAKQRVIIPIRSHLPIEHAQVCERVSCTIILDKLWCLELGRHNFLKEVGQTIQINASTDIGALYDTKLLGQSLYLALDLANPRFGVLVLRRICFLVIALGQYIVALTLYWWRLIFILGLGTSLTMARGVQSSSYNQLLHHGHQL